MPNSEAQAIAYNSWSPVLGYSGRLGSSKSRSDCEGALFDAAFWPRNRVLLTRKRATDLFATTLQILMDEVVPPSWRKGYRKSEAGGATLFLPNGSVIMFIGLDEPMKIRSGQYGSIYVDQAEDLDDEERKTAESRVRHRVRPRAIDDSIKGMVASMPNATQARIRELGGIPLRRRVVYAFNPSGDMHWGNVAFGFKRMQELPLDHPERWHRVIRTEEPVKLLSGLVVPPGALLREAVIARPTDNAQNLGIDYQIRLASQVGAWRDRYVLGLWGTFEGQVLPNFREAVHVIDRPKEWDDTWGGYPPPWWKRFRAVDFGYAPQHPFVMQWFARKPAREGKPAVDYLYQEIFMTGRLVTEHAKVANGYDQEEVEALNRGIFRWNASHPEKQFKMRREIPWEGVWLDHDAEDRATLRDSGISGSPAVKDRLPGAQLVAERLEQGRLLFVRTARRELDPVCRDAGRPTTTWEELSGLKWLKPPQSSENAAREDWVKDRDDGFDALRYFLLSERDRGGGMGYRAAA